MTLVDIEKDLLSIFEELEANGGELTEELSNKLTITEENFSDKVQKYLAVVKGFESDTDCIKEEISRLENRKKTKESQIEHLKKKIIDAVELFGRRNNKGNAHFECPTCKITVTNNSKLDVDGVYINEFVRNLNNNINNTSVYNANNNMSGIIFDANTAANTHIDNEDLNCMTVSATIKFDLKDLTNATDAYRTLLEAVDGLSGQLTATLDKKQLKGLIKENNSVPEYCTVTETKSLRIS